MGAGRSVTCDEAKSAPSPLGGFVRGLTWQPWSYAQLAERVVRDRKAHDCLEHIEGTAPDGTEYQMEFQALWNDKPGGEIIGLADFSAAPQRPLWGFIPIYKPDVTDRFIMSPDGHYGGEQETPRA